MLVKSFIIVEASIGWPNVAHTLSSRSTPKVSVLLVEGLSPSFAWPLPKSTSSHYHSGKNNGTSAFCLKLPAQSKLILLKKTKGDVYNMPIQHPIILRPRTYRKTVFSCQRMKSVMVWAKKEIHIIDSYFYDTLYESWKWKTIQFIFINIFFTPTISQVIC